MRVRTFRKWIHAIIGLATLSLMPGMSRPRGQDQATPDSIRLPQRVASFEHVNQELILKCDVGILIIKAYADNIAYIRYFPSSEKRTLPLWGFSATSLSPKYRVDSTLSAIKLSTSQLTVSVDRKTAQMTFLDQKQNILLSSKQYHLKSAQVSGEDTFNVHAEFIAPDDEAFYGLGMHGDGWMDQRGQTVRLWPDHQSLVGEVVPVPFLVTNRKYGFIFDNPSKTTVVPGKDGVTAWDAEVGDALSYFVICGNTTDELYKGYRFLTGATPLPPKSALGYILGSQRAETQEQLLQFARKYRKKGYPADMMAINLGDTGIDPKQWPDPGSLNAELSKLDFRVIVSCWPRIQNGSLHFDALDAMGCIAKDKAGKLSQDARGPMLDISKPSCASWCWNNIQENYASKGFTSWWLDGNEPDLMTAALSLDAGTGARIFNLYPLIQAKAVYEGHRRDLKERSLILSRSGYLGAQQYGTTFGSSDVVPQWNALRRQIPAGLNMTASGLPYWSSAIGGGPSPGASKSGDAQDDDVELYLRSFEFGTFCPTFRTQSSKSDDGVWSYGETAEKILAKYLGLRYRLLPYIYSLAHGVSETGAPFMRALFMDFPQDPEVRDIKDEYMFGPAFLVAPVVEKGKPSREVYLPRGQAWYDYWTGKKYPGGQRIPADAPLDVLPLFVKAGSIIPHGNDITSTHAEQKEVELWVYPGADAQFDLYQDDGTTYEYEKGKFSLAQIRWNEAAQKITVSGDDRKLFSHPSDKWLKIIR
ncbi:MAG: TIM-barrel domain-containing protein [Acidobacteriota bacterium]|jgi:alpha-glucosidase (family GH31 glycosyl hydrolase)